MGTGKTRRGRTGGIRSCTRSAQLKKNTYTNCCVCLANWPLSSEAPEPKQCVLATSLLSPFFLHCNQPLGVVTLRILLIITTQKKVQEHLSVSQDKRKTSHGIIAAYNALKLSIVHSPLPTCSRPYKSPAPILNSFNPSTHTLTALTAATSPPSPQPEPCRPSPPSPSPPSPPPPSPPPPGH